MGSQELSLTWEDHDRALMSVFERLLESNTFVDCTIAAEGQYLKAHKIVLSACSPYFELLFSQENEKNPIVIFKDIKFQELKAIIDFVYRGRVKIPEDRLGEFVEAAESLQINGLRGENERDDFQREENESSSLQKRGNRFISTRKDSRRGSISPGERNSGGISPEIVINNESNSCESILQIETSVDVPESPHSQHASVSVNTNSNATAHGSNEEVNKVESKSSSSCIPPVSVSMEKILVDTESIVKTEPEPMTEVFVPESECSIEKVEESDEEMTVADNDGSDSTMKRGVQNQDNQYSAFPIFMESSGVGSSDSFMTSHVADRISASGAAVPGRSSAAAGSPLQGELRPPLPRGVSVAFGPALQVFEDATTAAVTAAIPARKHTGERAFAWRECGETYTQAAYLKTHQGLHSGARSFSCPECGRGFTQAGNLLKHRRKHTGERPYRCEACGACFSRSDILDAHARIHTGEKPYKCPDCGLTSAHKSTIYKHRRLMHRAPPARLTAAPPAGD